MKQLLTTRTIRLLILFMSCPLLFSCAPSGGTDNRAATVTGSVSISGAFALYPLTNAWAEEFRKEYPEVRLNISAGGAGKGMADVLTGAAQLGMFSREVTPAEKEKNVWWISVAKDAVVPTISSRNPSLSAIRREGMTQKELSDIFLNRAGKTWKNSPAKVNVYTRADAAGAADVWAQYLGGKNHEDLLGIAVYGDPGLAEAVRNDPKGIGYNNINFVFDPHSGTRYPGLDVVPIDLDGNGTVDDDENFYHNLSELTTAIADGKYPSPPARELYFISRGEPTDPAVRAFLLWVLDKGQEFVQSNGYVKLSPKVIEAQKKKLQNSL